MTLPRQRQLSRSLMSVVADATESIRHAYRGFKPTATVTQSLRDEEIVTGTSRSATPHIGLKIFRPRRKLRRIPQIAGLMLILSVL
ncbi:MAG: hypothetical protein ACRD43_06310 [Pyrinomonadaceae bacterium]